MRERLACLHMGAVGRLMRREHRCDASVRSVEDRLPFRACFRAEYCRESPLHRRPGGRVHLRRELNSVEPETREQLRIELGLEGTDGDQLIVAGLVDLVEVRARI